MSTDSVIPLGGSSSSVREMLAEVMVNDPDVPDTVIVSSVSSTKSLVGVRVKVPVAEVVSAGMVMVKSLTELKSTAEALPLPDTETETSVAWA